MSPIDGQPKGKNILSMTQFSASDIELYIDEARAADRLLRNQEDPSINLLPGKKLVAVMRQDSTRTALSMTTAMENLKGNKELISGQSGSAEGKGETIEDSWVAYACMAHVIGTRTPDAFGPLKAAKSIDTALQEGNLLWPVPIINLGDGTNEHPTQALSDLYTIHNKYTGFKGLKLTVVGDHERYRAHHSLIIGALTVGMEILTVETDVAPVPEYISEMGGSKITRGVDLDEAMREANILYIGRRPDEYEKKSSGDDEDYNPAEHRRNELLSQAYKSWHIDRARLQKMSLDAMVLHPRPRNGEMNQDCDADPRTHDIKQMINLVRMRMAILVGAFGKSIRQEIHSLPAKPPNK